MPDNDKSKDQIQVAPIIKIAKHPAVVAAFIGGLCVIIGAIINTWYRCESPPPLFVITGGLYRDAYHEDGKWETYFPNSSGRERYWIGLHVTPTSKEVTIETFSAAGIPFESFGIGYENQKMTEEKTLQKSKTYWIATAVELNRWEEFKGILATDTKIDLLDKNGLPLGSYTLPAIAFP